MAYGLRGEMRKKKVKNPVVRYMRYQIHALLVVAVLGMIASTLYQYSTDKGKSDHLQEDSLLSAIPPLKLPYYDSISSVDQTVDQITRQDYNRLGLDSIETFQPDFEYRFLGKHPKRNVFLLERYYVEESVHWLIIINKNEVKEWKVTAYDNSEGFLYISSMIKVDGLTTYEHNIYSSTNEVVTNYEINTHGLRKVE